MIAFIDIRSILSSKELFLYHIIHSEATRVPFWQKRKLRDGQATREKNRENQDLISIGIVGLIKAVNTYNPDKGNRLVTYAAKCIENELLMMLRAEKKRSKDVSLNEPIGTDKEGNTISLIDVVENDEMDTLEQIEKAENISLVQKYVAQILNEREKEIIVWRYGLDGKKPMTQKKVGEKLGISRSYVSRIEKRALEKLKKALDNSYRM